MKYIGRDPFARETLMRENWPTTRTCDWCGNKRGTEGYLFRYVTVPDAGRPAPHRGLFCCKSCHDSYHDN
jgi:hypothetical protein